MKLQVYSYSLRRYAHRRQVSEHHADVCLDLLLDAGLSTLLHLRVEKRGATSTLVGACAFDLTHCFDARLLSWDRDPIRYIEFYLCGRRRLQLPSSRRPLNTLDERRRFGGHPFACCHHNILQQTGAAHLCAQKGGKRIEMRIEIAVGLRRRNGFDMGRIIRSRKLLAVCAELVRKSTDSLFGACPKHGNGSKRTSMRGVEIISA